MYPIKRILVGLDLTEMDETLIAYTSMLVETLGLEKAYFVHAAKSLDLPEKIGKQYPDLLAPLDESLERDIRTKTEKFFSASDTCEVEIEVHEGNATDKILRWSEIKEVDMILMGRKLELKGQGVLPSKLAKIAHCSIMLVPENTSPKISRIIIPVDFSKTSRLALDMGLTIKEGTDAEVLIQNSFRVPHGYHTTGKSFEEFAEIMKGHSKEDAVEFLQKAGKNPDDFEIVLILDKDGEPAEEAYEAASQNNADLIIIGSKGRSGLANILLGSVADKMIRLDADIPLLVVKDKKENMGFLQALMKI